ncbi:hypothetical protein [Roseateles sp.]|uniref:hypothetical protein n=1 Tax=Roseateles sp. TaxID=1971397 RepID=UPI0031E0B986
MGLPDMSAIDWSGFRAEIEKGQAIMANLGGSSASSPVTGPAPLTPVAWPVVTDNTRWTPPPASDGRSYIDTHHFDPDTGASVSTRRRLRREAGVLSEAMAGAGPQFPLAAPDAGAVPFAPVALRQLASVLANSMTAIA